jgi:hypothetical protein
MSATVGQDGVSGGAPLGVGKPPRVKGDRGVRGRVRRALRDRHPPRTEDQLPIVDAVAITCVLLVIAFLLLGYFNPMLPWVN